MGNGEDMPTGSEVSGSHKAELFSELLHAGVVLVVVGCTTILAALVPTAIPSDTVGVVFGAAIGYASGRAGGVSRAAPRSSRRAADTPGNQVTNGDMG